MTVAVDACSSAPAEAGSSAVCPKTLDGYVSGRTTARFVKNCLGPPVREDRNPDGHFVDLYDIDKTTVFAFLFDASGKLVRLRGYQPGTDDSIFRIPTTDWGILLDLPNIRKKSESGDIEAGYTFEGEADNLMVSFRVEAPRGTGNRSDDAYQYYWALAGRNALIDQKTVQVTSNARYTRVQYFLVRDTRGKSVRSQHVHYYAVHQGRWIDVHVSVNDPTDVDDAAIVGLDATLDFVNANP